MIVLLKKYQIQAQTSQYSPKWMTIDIYGIIFSAVINTHADTKHSQPWAWMCEYLLGLVAAEIFSTIYIDLFAV